MINKVIEKIIEKLIQKKLGIGNKILIKSIEVNSAGGTSTVISLNCDITVKNEDLLTYVDGLVK